MFKETKYQQIPQCSARSLIFGLLAVVCIINIYICYTYTQQPTLKIELNRSKYLIPQTIFIPHVYHSSLCNAASPSYLQKSSSSNDSKYWTVYSNIQRIKAFNQDFEIICFDDEIAYKYLKQKDESFAEYFKNEQNKACKADIFRVAVLYYEGGYFINLDLEPIMPLKNILTKEATFVSVIGTGGNNMILESFLGSTARNQILAQNMEILDDHYSNHRALVGLALVSALQQFTNETSLFAIQKQRIYKDQNIHLLTEKAYDGPNAAHLMSQRQKQYGKMEGGDVHLAVYDPATKLYPFWSSVRGLFFSNNDEFYGRFRF